MAYFKNPPQLNDEEKKFIFEKIKPLLQKNDLYEVRYILFDWGPYSETSNNTIRDFLLCHLGENVFFKGDDMVLTSEFYHSSVSGLTLPPNIIFIGNLAFESCENLEYVKILNNKEINIDVSSFKNTNCTIYIAKTCKVSLYGVSGFEPTYATEVLKEPTVQTRWNKVKELCGVDGSRYDSSLLKNFKIANDNFFKKVKLY